MAKADLLAEAAGLGIEGLDESFTNAKIQELIEEAAAEDAEAEIDQEPEVEAAPVAASEPTFTVKQLMPYAEQLFGVGGHVLVGAQSAGCFPAVGKITRDQARAGIDQYLKMPVEQSKED